MMNKIAFAVLFIVIAIWLYCLRYFDASFRNLRVWWYRVVYNIETGSVDGSMLPCLGKGKFISIIKKGDIIELIDEKNNRFLRVIPYQPNHGFMVEVWENKKMTLRSHMDIKMLAIAVGRNWYPIGSHEQEPSQC